MDPINRVKTYATVAGYTVEKESGIPEHGTFVGEVKAEGARLLDLVTELRRLHTDAKEVILIGYGQGGRLAYWLAQSSAVDQAVIAAGALPGLGLQPVTRPSTKVWAVHGLERVYGLGVGP